MVYPQDEGGGAEGDGRNRHPFVIADRPVVSFGAGAAALGPFVGSGAMALDAGDAPEEFKSHPDWRDPVPPITSAPTLGHGLRAARLASGRSLQELSTATRVHVRYLTALEENDWSVLPSRVFSIGYVRAYAAALGLDEQLAVERFKRDVPDGSVPLQAPVGVAFEEVRRMSPRIVGVIAVVALAIVGWNVFQRVSLMRAPVGSDLRAVPETWSLGSAPGVIRVGEPLPAPADQTVPVPYVTPGLEEELALATGTPVAAGDTGPVAKAFNPRGPVHGAAAAASSVTLQARRPSYIIVRLPDQRVLFARQLAAGEAWRAPRGVAAVVDVADPAAFDVYMNGEHAGVLPAAQTPVASLNARAEDLARQAAAQAEAERQAEIRQAQARAAEARATAPPASAAPVQPQGPVAQPAPTAPTAAEPIA